MHRYFGLSGSSVVFLLLLNSLFASSTFAQAYQDKAALEKARQFMEQGQAFYAQNEYAKAAEAFDQAYEAQPFSAFLYNAAIAHERNKNYAKAADLFEKYLDGEPSAEDAAKVKQRIELLRAASGEGKSNTQNASQQAVDQAVATRFKSLISVRTRPEGASVRIRNAKRVMARGKTPSAHTLEQGDYVVVVEHPDYRTVEIPVSVQAGKVYILIAEMSQGEFLGTLNVITEVPGAQVFIDDKKAGAVGNTPYLTVLPAGKHTVWLEKPGFQPSMHQVEFAAAEQKKLSIAMNRVEHGRIQVESNIYGAEVYVDDKLVGTTPYKGDVSAGAHTIRLEADDKKDWEGQVTVLRGQITPLQVYLHNSAGRASAWTMAILAAAFVGTGVAAGMWAGSVEDSLKADQRAGVLTSEDSRYLKGKVLAVGADVLFGFGAVFAAFSIYNFLRDPYPDSEARISKPKDWALLPYASSNGGGATLQGSF
ncbi:MAG: PEGA domain-containing protein [Myxococcales bacterium]|nr:MAG: PEGA domain-containing protein [Myxococcales bacterium]